MGNQGTDIVFDAGRPAVGTGRWTRGFSLAELLVTLVIMLVLMGALLMLFSSSLRAVKVGKQVIDANEEARAAYRVIERDLTNAFTSRDNADFFGFFGMPEGMMFVGLVRGSSDGNSEGYSVGRVTYAVHKTAGGGEFESADGVVKPTFGMVRYVERGVQDLDTFPIDWVARATAPEWSKLKDELDAVSPGNDFLSVDPALLTPEEAELINAKKRELWIRMVAGDTDYPAIVWDGTKSPDDYVVLENIADAVTIDRGHFEYGRVMDAYGNLAFLGEWNSNKNVEGINAATPNDLSLEAAGSPFRPQVPSVVKVNFSLVFESPYVGAPDYERMVDAIIDVPVGYERPLFK